MVSRWGAVLMMVVVVVVGVSEPAFGSPHRTRGGFEGGVGEAGSLDLFNSTTQLGAFEVEKLCSAGVLSQGCPKIGMDMRDLSLKMIRADILRKLRLEEGRLPNMTNMNIPIPPAYLSEFMDEMQADAPRPEEPADDDHASTEKIIAFSRILETKVGPRDMVGAHYFTFSDKLGNMRVESAYLYVHVKQNNPGINFSIRISELVHSRKSDYPIPVDFGHFKPMYRASTEFSHSRHSRNRWVQLDISGALSKWISLIPSASSKKIGLVLEIFDTNGNPTQDISIITSNYELDVNSNPFIEVHVSEKKRSRPTRNIGMTCDENSKETRCCRYPLVVDFEEFGWDWIIAPKKYDANYCSGECPYAFLQKYPHNHIVQQTNIAGPCCSSRKMSSISMLYFDSDSNIVFSVLPGMVVEKCGCS